MKISEKEQKKLKKQLNISDRKTVEERGLRPRPAIFVDKKKKQDKEVCKKENFLKEISDFEDR